MGTIIISAFAQQIIPHVTSDPVKDFILPVAEKLRYQSEQAFKEEDRLRTHPEEVDEGAVAEVSARSFYYFLTWTRPLIKCKFSLTQHWSETLIHFSRC